jgi:putative Mn2+ efflux pump MntP
MEKRNRRSVLTGGMILIGLGLLIIFHKMSVWAFGQSWPVLLLVVALGTLIQQPRDPGGWIIGCVGLIFLVSENFGMKIYAIASFLLPLLLILVGINVLWRHFGKMGQEKDHEP